LALGRNFEVLGNYRSAVSYAGKCRERANEARYHGCLNKYKTASTGDEYLSLGHDFVSFGGYEDAPRLADECFSKANAIKAESIREAQVRAEASKKASIRTGLSILPIIVFVVAMVFAFLSTQVLSDGSTSIIVLAAIIIFAPSVISFYLIYFSEKDRYFRRILGLLLILGVAYLMFFLRTDILISRATEFFEEFPEFDEADFYRLGSNLLSTAIFLGLSGILAFIFSGKRD
jgi:hypothetical protein